MEARSEAVNAKIFIDATLSMEGFVLPGSSTDYARTIPVMEGAIEGGWARSAVQFYQFGSKILPVAGRGFLKAQQPSFYQNPAINRETRIEKVIDGVRPGEFTIIITDLFQDDNDLTLLVSKLKEKCFQHNLSVGIAGIKSQYDGTVYDVGMNKDAFRYRSGVSASRFRPFYILVTGKHADIAHYFDQLKANGLPASGNFLIVSRHIAHPLPQFADATIDSISDLFEDGGLLSDESDRRTRQFGVRADRGVFVTTLAYKRLSYTMPFDSLDMKIEITARKHIAGIDSLVVSSDAQRGFSARLIRESHEQLTLRCELDMSSLPDKTGTYLSEMVLYPENSAYKMPDWVSEWNMPLENMDRWKNKQTNFDGATTLNLHPFLNQLWQAVIQTHRPIMAHLYCYVQKR